MKEVIERLIQRIESHEGCCRVDARDRATIKYARAYIAPAMTGAPRTPLPCPFCGEMPSQLPSGDEFLIGCDAKLCPANTWTSLKLWNTRVSRRDPEGSEIQRLQGIIERDRSWAIEWIKRVQAEISKRRGISQSRGSYTWDDDEYRKEFCSALDAIEAALSKAQVDTHARDLSDCPTTQAEVEKARDPEGLRQVVEQAITEYTAACFAVYEPSDRDTRTFFERTDAQAAARASLVGLLLASVPAPPEEP